jgi:hypothetical protein
MAADDPGWIGGGSHTQATFPRDEPVLIEEAGWIEEAALIGEAALIEDLAFTAESLFAAKLP